MQTIWKSMRAASVAFLCALVPIRGQTQSRQPVPSLSVRYEKAAGDSGSAVGALIVHVEIASGWHINSNAPLDEFLVPTTVEARAEGLEFGPPKFPTPERVHSDAFGGDILLFSGAFDVEMPVLRKTAPKPAVGAQAWPRTRVTLKYQACDHATCYAPKEVSLER